MELFRKTCSDELFYLGWILLGVDFSPAKKARKIGKRKKKQGKPPKQGFWERKKHKRKKKKHVNKNFPGFFW